ncbi:MAG: rhodanese-like domain-containing protein [bacterium]|nr:rhodanese-like domain-containing protein [bacterium]
MEISTFRTDGLGDSTYLLIHDGVGVVVDPQRDVERFEQAIAGSGIELCYVLETHIHNDYVSGGRELARRTGAQLVLPAAAGVAFDHLPAFHTEDLGGDGLVIRPLHTPGHTAEHMSYLILVDGAVRAVFSGGSLLVGSAGRSDLLGDARAEQLARLQYLSVRRLAELPDETALYPTHGEGSFCTASGAGRHTSTIGVEKLTNPVLAYESADAFAAGQLGGLQPFPSYYAHMGPINLLGPEPLPRQHMRELEFSDLPPGANLVDIRPRSEYAAGHVPGSLGLELSDQVAVWAGWLLPFNSPVALVANRDQDVDDVSRQFGRIGFDKVLGAIYGVEGWVVAGGSLVSCRTRTPAELASAVDHPCVQVLDVRSPGEWEEGHIENSVYSYLPDLGDGLPEELDGSKDLWVACGSGYRATAAVRFLESADLEPVVVTPGGIPDTLEAMAARS